jgi:chromosome segregation ATPase
MAYVRTRTSKNGAVSTTLVEAYRDDQGRPRQRVMTNLHGEPDVLSALAKLAALRDALRKELAAKLADKPHADLFYETVTTKTLHRHQYSDAERREIDKLMRQRDQLLRRLDAIPGQLDRIEREGAAIKKHCTATPKEIQAAIKAYQKKRHDAECLVLSMEFVGERLREARAELRRLDR